MATRARAEFERDLQTLRQEVLNLGSMVEKAVERAVEALKRYDVALARSIIEHDREIDERSYALEERALLLIATQQPMATDLRIIAATLFIISELERMGDYAEGLAKIAIRLSAWPPLKPLIDIPRMAEISIDMLRQALDAFIEMDLERCRAIWSRDDEVDALYDQVYRELLTYMMSDPRTIERATLLLWAAHNLERIADRVTNICERIAFVITGDPRALVSPAEPDYAGEQGAEFDVE
ncbi:MAG: phosphate signaling complex protein PhoU [Thermomicrobium sp.]